MITTSDMQALFDRINEVCFEGKLPACELRVVKDNITKAPAFCESWDSRVHTRISFCEKYLKRISNSLEEVMLHEMLHYHLYLKYYAHLVGPGYHKAMGNSNRRDDLAGHTIEFFLTQEELLTSVKNSDTMVSVLQAA